MLPARGLLATITGACLALGVNSALCADDNITLGAALSLTGTYAINGANTKHGYDLAIRQINDKGGIEIGGRTYKLDVRYYDDESMPARGTELVERLIQQDGVQFILGPYSSGLTKAVVPVVERHGVPMVEANGAARELFTRGARYVFAVLSTSEQYMRPVIDLAVAYAHKFGKAAHELRLALATARDPFARDVRDGVVAGAKERGVGLVIDDQLPPELDDMSMTLFRVKAVEPDVLIVSGHAKGALTAVRQIDALQVNVPMIAMTHCDSARVAKAFPKTSSHIFCAQQWHRSLKHRGDLFGSAQDFAEFFAKIYGYEPPYQAAQSAAAVYVFADAFERAQSLEPEAVRDALAATDMQTFYGPIKFDETGKNIAKPMALTQIIDGRYVVVAPPEWAEQEPVIPRPKR